MKPLYIFRHLECEGPGYLDRVLEHYDIPYQLICIDQQDSVPHSVDECSGLVFMGGPMSVNDPLPWIDDEIRLIHKAMDRRMPVLGHCLGGQLIAKALGMPITANPVKEIGWLPVMRETSDAAVDWAGNLPEQFEAFHWHGETFALPPAATHLLRSEHCPNQGFAMDNCLALQCHIEMTVEMVHEWARVHRSELKKPSATVQSGTAMSIEIEDRVEALQAVADKLYHRWLRPLL